jgi:hypothetical protein
MSSLSTNKTKKKIGYRREDKKYAQKGQNRLNLLKNKANKKR